MSDQFAPPPFSNQIIDAGVHWIRYNNNNNTNNNNNKCAKPQYWEQLGNKHRCRTVTGV